MRIVPQRAKLSSQTTAIVALALLALGAATEEGAWDLRAPEPKVALRPERVERVGEYGCARCHTEVAAEWSASAHGIAWADELYQDEIADKKRPELCHGCHIPEPLLAGGALAEKPKARAGDDRHLGISCESCHVGAEGVVLGPRGTPTDAHASRAAPEQTAPGSNALCSACHSTNIGPVVGIAKDFAASKQAERGRSCVGCHMHEVERRWADGESVPARKGRSHAIQTPRDPTFLRRAFELSLSGTKVVVANRAGHRVPGLIGREIRFEAEALDAAGAVLCRGELALDARTYLPVDGKLEIALAKAGASVRVVGRHADPRAEEPVVFLDEKLVPGGR